MVSTCQTDADVGASDIDRPGGLTCLAETCGLGSRVRGFELADLRSRPGRGRAIDDR
jgi:hypothetical protein